jgi:hypothetical protein
MCKVKNRGAGYVTYRIPEDGIRRSFAPGETKTISCAELEKLTYQPGGMTLLLKYLQVLDEKVISNFNMRVEPEYFMSEKDIVELLLHGSLDAFLDTLDFAPTGVIDLIKKLSISLPLTDFNKRRALRQKLGFDVDAALKHIEEEKEDEGQTTILKTTERRVKTEEAPAGRRTTSPKYNIINKTAEATSAE